MKSYKFTAALLIGAALLFPYGCSPEEKKVTGGSYEDLLGLFQDFREFQKPAINDGIPDYSSGAMKEQAEGLKLFQQRLTAMDIADWPISQQVDYHLVRAEMNALEFHHRVLRPWERNPSFYLRSRIGCGPSIHDAVRFPDFPVSSESLDDFHKMLTTVPAIFDQAKRNLSKDNGYISILTLRWSEDEISIYGDLLNLVKQYHPELAGDAELARLAAEEYHNWLSDNQDMMRSPMGVGIENYNWWLKNVLLFPYTWDELNVLADREYQRAYTALKLTENNNRNLPPIVPVNTEEEYNQRWNEFEDYTINFIRENGIFTVPEYLVPDEMEPWWNAQGGVGEQDFFKKCRDLNPLSEICHGLIGHTFYWLRHERDDRPIRGAYPQYGMEMIDDEGIAFGVEEMLLYAGLSDDYPRGKEITYVAQIFRAVRMKTDLKIHSNEFTLQDVLQYYTEEMPDGWVRDDTYNTMHDIDICISLPGYAMGYVGGKFQLEKLMANRAHQLGDEFNLGTFFDEFFAAGRIPISLAHWEITGLEDEIKKLW